MIRLISKSKYTNTINVDSENNSTKINDIVQPTSVIQPDDSIIKGAFLIVFFLCITLSMSFWFNANDGLREDRNRKPNVILSQKVGSTSETNTLLSTKTDINQATQADLEKTIMPENIEVDHKKNLETPMKQKPQVIAMGAEIEKGSLPKDIIHRIIQNRAGGYQNCYNNQIKIKKDLNGTIHLILKISATTGRIILAKVDKSKSDMNSPDLEQCIINQLQYLWFPHPEDARHVVVRYPFQFKAN